MSKHALDEFRQHLIGTGKTKATAENYLWMVRRFLKHVGETQVDRISEAQVAAFFATLKNKQTRRCYANAVDAYLRFAVSRLPVPVNAREAESPRAPVPAKLRQRWSVDKLTEQKNKDDDLIAKLARKVIDHYLYFQHRLKGEPENLDDLVRFADECRDLIESNLPLFMALSAGGRNVHSAIDERVQR